MKTGMGQRSLPAIVAGIILLVSAWGAYAQDPVPSVTTSDGQTFKDVKVFKRVGDQVLLIHSEGTATVPLDGLSDEARKSLGLPTRDEQAKFEADQKEKGLVKSGHDWLTPAEKQLKEFFAALTTLIPDWKAINLNPQFAAWLENKAPGGQTWRQVAEAAVKAADAAAVAKVFNTWKADQKVAPAVFAAYLDNLIPDWRDVTVNPQFLAWIGGSNPGDRWSKFALVEQARGRRGAGVVANAILVWKVKVQADQIAQPSLQSARDRADQQAEKVQRAIQDQTDAINDHTAAIPVAPGSAQRAEGNSPFSSINGPDQR